jgi:hypothetical protein
VQTIQRQAVELAHWRAEFVRMAAMREHNGNMAGMWQALAEGLAKAATEYMDKCPADADETPSFYAAGLGLSQALAAQEAAKSANHD